MPTAENSVFRTWARRCLFALAILAAPAAYSEVAATVADRPEPGTLLGNYLAGRVARGDHDTAAAADFYSRALAEDPTNELILEQAFLLETAAADWDRAVELARDLVKVEPTHRIAQFLLGCEAFKRGDYKEADEHLAAARQGPIADLTSILARAWVQQANGKTDQAFATLDTLSDADWAQFYQRYHRALIADVAGKREVARVAFAQAFKKNPATLRVADAYARHLVDANNRKIAKQTLKTHIAKSAHIPCRQRCSTTSKPARPRRCSSPLRTMGWLRCFTASATLSPARAASTWASSSCNSRSTSSPISRSPRWRSPRPMTAPSATTSSSGPSTTSMRIRHSG
jgi:tetratricopeptide (TPR) repeat protein